MKKYRLTKITVKTREIVSMSKNATGEAQIPVCPICHTPLTASLHTAGNSAAEIMTSDQRPTMLPPAEVSEDRSITD